MSAGGKNFVEMIDKRFGALVVLERKGSKGKLAVWKCKCDCGKECDSVGAWLRSGRIKTCGCRIEYRIRKKWRGYKDISGTYWKRLVIGAEQRFIEFNLTIEEAWNQWIKQDGNCVLTGEKLLLEIKNHTASLDRIRSNECYNVNNIQWIHKDINKLKSSFDEEKFINLCLKVANHANKRLEQSTINEVSSNNEGRTQEI